MSNGATVSDQMDRLQKQLDNIADKQDQMFTLMSDMRAYEQVTVRRFEELDRRHIAIEKKIADLNIHMNDKLATKEEVSPLKTAYSWTSKIIITAVVAALLSLVVVKPGIPADNVIFKPREDGEES